MNSLSIMRYYPVICGNLWDSCTLEIHCLSACLKRTNGSFLLSLCDGDCSSRPDVTHDLFHGRSTNRTFLKHSNRHMDLIFLGPRNTGLILCCFLSSRPHLLLDDLTHNI